MEEQDVAQNSTDNTVTHGIYENVVAHVDNDNVDIDPDWSANGPSTSAKPVGRPPKRGRGRPRIHQRGGNTNRGRTTRTQPQAQPQAQEEPRAHNQPFGQTKTVTLFFEPRKTRLTAKKEDLVLQETIRTSAEPDSRHGSRALSAGADQDTVNMKTGFDARASKASPDESSPDYAVKPLHDVETTRKLPHREMAGGKKTRGNDTKSDILNGSRDHAQGFIRASEALIYPDGFSKSEQQTALGRYGDDIVSEFRVKWREVLKLTDTQNQRRSVDVWKSLLDPDLATRFRASLSGRYRDYIDQCKRKMEQGIPKRNSSGQPANQQREKQQHKQPRKRQYDEEESQEKQESPVVQYAKRRKLTASPQPEQPGKRQQEEAEPEEQDYTPIFADPRASPQPESSPVSANPYSPNPSPSTGNLGPGKGSAWRVIREPNGNYSATDVSRMTNELESGESPTKKFSFRMQRESIAKVQTVGKNSLAGKR